MKQVSDEAINRLKIYEMEHKQILERTRQLHESSQIGARDTSYIAP